MKIFFALILMSFLAAATAGTDLVLNLDGIVVQGIPLRSASFFEAKDVITLSTGKKFVKLPQAEAFLKKLQLSGFIGKVILTGARSASENAEIFRSFADVDQSFFEVRGDEIESFIDTKVSSGDRLLIISEKDLASDPGHGAELIVMKPTFYHFTTFDAAKAESRKVKADQKGFFPTSADDWDLHLSKRGRLFFILLSTLESGAASLAKLLKDNAKKQGEVGETLLAGNGRWTVWSWKKNVCEKHNLKTGIKELVSDLAQCAKNLAAKKYWEGQSAQVCLVYSEADALLGKLGPDVCEKVDTHRVVIGDQVLFIKSFAGLESLTTAEILSRFSRTSSFRNLLKSPAKAAQMSLDLGAACAAAINKITDDGKTLASTVLQKSIKPLSSIRFFSGKQDNTFYHWTSGPGLISTLKLDSLSAKKAFDANSLDGTFEGLFHFLRVRQADMYQFWRRVFYVAEDPQSSSFLGDKVITFDLDMKSPTISYDHSVWKASLDEVGARFPELKNSCKMGLTMYVPDTFGALYFDNIFFVIAEDSGVEVVDYNQQQKWFQLLSPRPIKGLKLGL